jgi:ADP-dependent NAD(P)H-hydrate dehydratase
VIEEAPSLPRHDDDESKADRGTVLVIGGGRSTPGAVVLAGLAALRVGAGKLQIATVASVAVPLAVQLPEALVVALAESAEGHLAPEGAGDVGARATHADAVLIGPGVLDDHGMDALLGAVLTSTRGTVVVDAGALPALARHGRVDGRVVAVPNASELSELGGDDPHGVARELGCVVACRDAATRIAHPDGRTWTERSGCVGLATSGSGDVAAGAVAGLAARGATPEAAAFWGARLHGQAGERLSVRVGPLGFLARELLDELPHVLPQDERSRTLSR